MVFLKRFPAEGVAIIGLDKMPFRRFVGSSPKILFNFLIINKQCGRKNIGSVNDFVVVQNFPISVGLAFHRPVIEVEQRIAGLGKGCYSKKKQISNDSKLSIFKR